MEKGRKKYLYIIFIISLILFFIVIKFKLQDKLLVTEEIKSPNLEYLLEEDIREISILAAGDVMYHMPQVNSAYVRSEGIYDFSENFKYVKDYISSADISIVNYETVAGPEGSRYSGYPNFNTPKQSLESLKYAGFDIINTANNHILDQGKNGLLYTIDEINRLGLKNLGTSNNGFKDFLIKSVDDIELGFLSYSYGFNGNEYRLTESELTEYTSVIDEEKIKNDIKTLKSKDIDFVIVVLHWGQEYSKGPSLYQEELADKIFAWGGDIILGSHPHVIHKSEKKEVLGRDKFVVYSLGNFLSNQRRENLGDARTEDGLMVKLILEKDFIKKTKRIKEIKFIPTWVNKYYKSRNIYNIVPVEDVIEGKISLENYKDVEEKLKESYNRSSKLINIQ